MIGYNKNCCIFLGNINIFSKNTVYLLNCIFVNDQDLVLLTANFGNYKIKQNI